MQPMSAPKRKLWSVESMAAAVDSVLKENKGLREAARLYNIPTETLRRHVSGAVSLHCRPGPATVLTEEEEEKLANYLVKMADIGFRVTREGIMGIAYSIVEKTGRSHPFKNGTAGRAWFEGFMRRHPNLNEEIKKSASSAPTVLNKNTASEPFNVTSENSVSEPRNVTSENSAFEPLNVTSEKPASEAYNVTSEKSAFSSSVLNEVLALPQPVSKSRTRQRIG